MTTPNPSSPDPKPVFTALAEAFAKLPAPLSFGGLVLVAAILLAWLTGNLPDILLVVPAAALVAFLVYAYLNNRHEIDRQKLELQREADERQHAAEMRKLEMELERLKVQQTGDLERERIQLERDKLKADPPVAASPPPARDEPPPVAAWPGSYYQYVWQKCAQLHMTSIDPKAQELGASILNLHSVFTELDVPSQERETAPRAFLNRREMQEREREPSLAALSRAENQKLVLLGQPGSGKSTLVKYLALCLSGAGLQDAETNLQSLIDRGWRLSALLPILVVLRDYAAKGLPQKQSLWAFIAASLKNAGLSDCLPSFSQHLKQHGGILLLDGLDEVPEAQQRREQLREAILQFVREFSLVRLVVTSRPYAYQNPAWHLPGFSQTTLLDFTPEQIESYVDRWYAVAGPLDPNLGVEQAKRYAAQLKDQVKRNSNLQELAPRPLLLALMVSLHRWRGGGLLPERREQLYDASVNLLLDLWQRPKLLLDERGRPQGQETNALAELGIDALALRRALSQLAYEVHHDQPGETAGTADIPHEKLVAVLRQAAPKEKRDAIPYQKIADYVRDRAGLLEDRGEGVYGFPHRTFQEYLAAMHLLDREDFPTNIVSLARQDPARWREATLLAGNSAQTTLQWALVEQLYEREDAPQDGQPVTEAQWWGVYLAGQALHDSDLLAKETKLYRRSLSQVQAWHKAILTQGALPPRDRAKAGDVLAELGDDRPGVLACDDMRLCYVPPGPFWMADSEQSRQGRWLDILDKPYWLGQYPVTVSQFHEFARDSRYQPTYGDRYLSDPLNRPVMWVNWYDALAFCDWLQQRWQPHLPPGYRVTLPNEAEWEKGARGGRVVPQEPHVTTVHALRAALDAPPPTISNARGQREYPWGDEPPQPENEAGLYRANNEAAGVGRTTAVGSFPAGASPVGCLDLSGNVWEWTRSFYDKPRPYRLSSEYETANPRNQERVLLCGGAFYVNYVGCSARFDFFPLDIVGADLGFRVVVSPFVSEL